MKKLWIPLLTVLAMVTGNIAEARSRFCWHHPYAHGCRHHHYHHHHHRHYYR